MNDLQIKKLIEKLETDLIIAAKRANDYAESKDLKRNCINYGIANKCADILTFLKQDVTVPCYDDSPLYSDMPFIRIPKVIIKGKETKYEAEKNKQYKRQEK